MLAPELNVASRSKQRSQACLDTLLDKNLRAYDTAARATAPLSRHLAASAAIAVVGFGMFALPQETSAEVVFTPVNQSLLGNGQFLQFDLNNDGIQDVSVNASSYTISGSGGPQFAVGDLRAHALQPGNAIAGKDDYAYAGKGGQRLGPSAHFSSNPTMANCTFEQGKFSSHGQWNSVKNRRFLGVKFLISGETHYGWIRFNSANTCGLIGKFVHATVSGYAYETIANKPIVAGLGNDGFPAPKAISAPGSLGQLAVGAAGR